MQANWGQYYIILGSSLTYSPDKIRVFLNPYNVEIFFVKTMEAKGFFSQFFKSL